VLSIIGIFLYAGIPWPDPAPYPGVQVQEDTGCPRSFGCARTATYTVTLGIDELQEYYSQQMDRHCTSEWSFRPEPVYSGNYKLCRAAECKTRRLGLDQFFRVRLCITSGAETYAYQAILWED
jgi:hypothetical protein